MTAKIKVPDSLYTDMLIAICITAFGLIGWHSGQSVSARAMLWPNAVFWSLIITGIAYLSFLVFKLIVYNIRGNSFAKKKMSDPAESQKITLKEILLMAITALLVYGYVRAFPVVGFYTTTFCILIVLPVLLGYRNYQWILTYALTVTVFLWVVFSLLLNRSLPSGILI